MSSKLHLFKGKLLIPVMQRGGALQRQSGITVTAILWMLKMQSGAGRAKCWDHRLSVSIRVSKHTAVLRSN